MLGTIRSAVTYLKDRLTGNSKAQAEVAETKLTDAINDVNLENENNIDTVGEMPYTETRYRISDKNRSSREADARKERLIRDFSGKVNVDYVEIYMDDQEKAMVRSAIKSGNGVLSSNNRKGRVFAYDSYYIFDFNEDNSVTIIERLVADDDRIYEYEEAFFRNEERTTGFNSDRNAKRDRSVSGRRIHDNADVSQQAGEVDGIRTVDTTELRRTQNYGSGNGVGISDGSGGIDTSKNQADLSSNLETTSYETEKQGPTLTDDRGGLFVQNGAEQDPDAEKNTAQTDGERYSIKNTKTMNYQDQIKLLENGKFKRSDSLYIGTPYAKTDNSIFSEAPLAMNQSDYRKSRRESGNNKNYSSHGVPVEFFENLPQYLKDAPMFIDNGNKATVITSYPQNDKNGNPSYEIAGIWKNQPMENDTVNLVKSIYPYDDLAIRIKNAAENGTLVIANKNKAAEMLTTVGVQPAEVSNILNLAKGSISQSDPTVKEQFAIKRDSSVDDAINTLREQYGDMPELQALIEKYGALPKGEKPFRDVELPERTAEDEYVSRTVRTILEAKATPEIALKPIEKLVAEGDKRQRLIALPFKI